MVKVMTNLKFFGEWVKWEAAMQLDRRWHSLLAYQTDNQLKYRLLATEDQFPTPSRLCMWGVGDRWCSLCLPFSIRKKALLLLILCGCEHAMKEDKLAGPRISCGSRCKADLRWLVLLLMDGFMCRYFTM